MSGTRKANLPPMLLTLQQQVQTSFYGKTTLTSSLSLSLPHTCLSLSNTHLYLLAARVLLSHFSLSFFLKLFLSL